MKEDEPEVVKPPVKIKYSRKNASVVKDKVNKEENSKQGET